MKTATFRGTIRVPDEQTSESVKEGMAEALAALDFFEVLGLTVEISKEESGARP